MVNLKMSSKARQLLKALVNESSESRYALLSETTRFVSVNEILQDVRQKCGEAVAKQFANFIATGEKPTDPTVLVEYFKKRITQTTQDNAIDFTTKACLDKLVGKQ